MKDAIEGRVASNASPFGSGLRGRSRVRNKRRLSTVDSQTLSFAPALADRRTISEHVADSLRTAIRRGELPAGAELNQIALAAQYGTSRAPVREAMRQLQAEGWIEGRPHQRAVVREMSSEQVVEMLEIRAVLEDYLIRRTVPKASAESLDALDARCDEMDAANDHSRWLDLNRAFHCALHEPSGALTAIALVEQLSSQVEHYVRERGENIAHEGEAVAEHRAIVQAVRNRDVATARKLIHAHIAHTLNRFKNTTALLAKRTGESSSP